MKSTKEGAFGEIKICLDSVIRLPFEKEDMLLCFALSPRARYINSPAMKHSRLLGSFAGAVLCWRLHASQGVHGKPSAAAGCHIPPQDSKESPHIPMDCLSLSHTTSWLAFCVKARRSEFISFQVVVNV